MKIICITPIAHLKGLLEEMKTYGEVIYEPEISKVALTDYLKKHKDIDAIFTNPNKQNYKLDKEILAGSSIKLINTASTGLNHIDVKWCEVNKIKILSLTTDFELIKRLPSTAELSFGLMLALLRHIPKSHDSVKAGEWNYEAYMGRQTEGLTLGIIGYGRLGYFMAKYGEAFGMRVLTCDPYKTVYGFEQVSHDIIAKESDVISLHVHVTDETRHMINKDFISKTTKQPYLINTSRGEIVDELAVIEGLKSKKLAGYGTDVIEDEFGNRKNSPIIKAINEGLNIVATPHIGGMTWEGQERAFGWAIRKFKGLKI